MAAISLLSDADLHGLVDGHIDADRRADVLRRAAASPRDRALIEAWTDQNDLIRAAFATFEPVPRALDLRTPPQLHAVPLAALVSPAVAKPARWRQLGGTLLTMAAVAAGLVGSWYVSGLSNEEARPTVAQAAPAPVEDRMLADRTMAALAFGEAEMPVAAVVAEPPPTAAIPDLSGAGFTFTGAEARGVSPKSVIFRYRGSGGERVAVGAIRVAGGDSEPARRDGGFTWRRLGVAYAVFGTVAPERLSAIASALRTEGRPE